MLRLHGCTAGYASQRVLENLSLEISAGELIAIVGSSGCGKTTLLNVAAGIHQVESGSVTLDGTPLLPGDNRVALVQQHYGLFPWFTVERNVALALELRGSSRNAARQRAVRALEELGLGKVARRYPGELSGGQQQRVALARVRAWRPDLLLMDEPFSALDALTREELQEALLRLENDSERKTLFVTHNLEEAVFIASRVGIMYGNPATLDIIDNPWLRTPAERTIEERGSREFLEALLLVRTEFEERLHG